MPRVREAHWRPGVEWPRPACPGPEGKEPACGAPVEFYKPPGGEPAHEIEWSPEDPVMLHPCGHVVAAEAVGVVAFTAPPREREDHERVRDAGQMYLSQYG